MATDSILAVREFEGRLSRQHFRGVAVGPALAHLFYCYMYHDHAVGVRRAVKDWVRFFRHLLYTRPERQVDFNWCQGRVLATCISPSFRYTKLMFPVIEHLGRDRCVLMYGAHSTAASLPHGVVGLDAHEAARSFDRGAWRRDFRRLWPEVRRGLRQIVREFALPCGAYSYLADAALTCTQWIAGCQEFCGVPALWPC